MKDFFTSPTVQRWGGLVFAAGFYVLSTYFPAVADALCALAGAAAVGPTAYHMQPPAPKDPS